MMTSLCKDARRRDICLAQSSDCVPWASGLLWTALDTKLVEAGGNRHLTPLKLLQRRLFLICYLFLDTF